MRVFDNGAFYTVQVTGREVYEFSRRWPCSGLQDGPPVTFQFARENGDLVDYSIAGQYGPDYEARHEVDGGALVALSEDAQRYGSRRLAQRGGGVE